MPKFYPAFLQLKGKCCLVVGGGEIAYRKVLPLLAAGGAVRVVAPRVTAPLARLRKQKRIQLTRKKFQVKDLAGCFVVVAATDDHALNRRVFAAAERRRMLANVVDDPALCNFIVPAVVQRGPLMIAVSTSGRSPLLARRIREDLETRYGKEFEKLLKWVGAFRKQIIDRFPTAAARKVFWERAIPAETVRLLSRGRVDLVKASITRAVRGRRA